MALKVGPDKFYNTFATSVSVRRTGVELPGRNARACCVQRIDGDGSSIGSHRHRPGSRRHSGAAGVDGLDDRQWRHLPAAARASYQLSRPTRRGCQRCCRSRFRAGEELPNPLPDGAHRVISELTAAQMRKMMEGVVLYGTGKPAQLNGYSSGGKTGTAQKVDPRHASLFEDNAHRFVRGHRAGQQSGDRRRRGHGQPQRARPITAPPFLRRFSLKSRSRCWNISASRTTSKCSSRRQKQTKQKIDLVEDDADADQNQVNALFAAVNDLPADDPLRNPQPAVLAPVPKTGSPLLSTQDANAASSAVLPPASAQDASSASHALDKPAPPQVVTISDGKKFACPRSSGCRCAK